jgi:hypothetical protein
MKKIALCMTLLSIMVSCQNRTFFKNQTRPGGYAMGEVITLKFSTNATKSSPDSVSVFVLEKKTDFRYSLWARRTVCQDVCQYEARWNGRKPDGSWPEGGRYFVYAVIGDDDVYSDTIKIGLGD